MRVSTVQTLAAYLDDEITAMPNLTSVGTLTALTVDNITINGNDISSTAGTDLTITPLSGQQIVLDGTIVVDAGVVTGATSITSTAFVGGLTGNVTGNASGTALTVTQAAQSAITSVGTLTALTVDDVVIDGKVMTMTGSSGDTFVTTVAANGATSLVTTDASAAAANFSITADGTVDIDSAGVLTLDSGAAINIEPASGSAILLDGTISIDAGVVTGATSITSTAFVGDITGDVTGTADVATVATTVTITDNESTDEANAVIFTAGADIDGGNIGLESDGNLTYNPSSGTLAATTFSGSGASLGGVSTSRRNLLVNGAFDIWQRGTSFTHTNGKIYVADRWIVQPQSTAHTFTQVAASSPIAGMGSRYALRIQRNADVTATGFTYFAQDNESSMAYHCQGKKITLSYFARKGADYSATSDYFSLGIVGGKGIDQALVSGYTSAAFLVNTNATLTTSWQRFSFTTGVVPSDVTQIGLQGGRVNVGTAGANDYVDITGIQLEVGDEATDFEYTEVSATLKMCERYYQKLTGSYAQYGQIANMNYNSSSQAQSSVVYRTEMRAAPSLSYTSTSSNNSSSAYAIANGSSNSGGVDYIDTLILFNQNTISTLLYTGNTAGGTAREAGNLYVNADITELALVADL
jgi:hypothetical protein